MTTVTPTHDSEPEVTAHADGTDGSKLDRFGHQRPRYDDINVPVIVLIGVISAIITFLTIAFVEGLSLHWQNGLIKTLDYDVTNPRQIEVVNDQKAILEGDEEKGILSLDSVIDDVVVKFRRTDEAGGQAGSSGKSADQVAGDIHRDAPHFESASRSSDENEHP